MNTLKDKTAREQATHPGLSFIVQAPAGSGKTEILTQRYLRLLSTVTAPEQIVALTFTRKAANEMRERILLSLQQVAKGCTAQSAHQEKTYSYARDALERDKQLDWQLLQQSNRLRVMTIDSLCQGLTHAIPLQEKQIHYAQITDTPHQQYLKAAHACLTFALEHEDYHPTIKILLEHVDNQQDRLLSLWTDLLAIREQWLGHIYQANGQDKIVYEEAIACIEQHELTRFRQTIPPLLKDELTQLSRAVACIENNPASPRYILKNWLSFDQLDGKMAQGLCALILTSQNTIRKAFDHHVGLKRDHCPNDEYDQLKAASKTILTLLSELPDCLDALKRIQQLPEPDFNPEQWEVLQALLTLLPVLAAHLTLVFSEQDEVDFSAIAQYALTALGDDDCPTDLALYLDHRIHHLLVDEFQDTSIQQFQLLEKLTHGWEPGDGKTLFLVGDPMQSIYRFRAAEVGLFLRAKQHGIGAIHLKALELTCNFRSTETMVDWVNGQFRGIFPQLNDIESGAVSFHASDPVKPHMDSSFIKAYQYSSREQEAQALVEIIQNELSAFPDETMAILVRSRRQLIHIVRALRQANIVFQGVDIDLLANLPHLRDVWSLTQALLMPANRLAWLSILRSPWCGLSLADIHAIAQFDRTQSIYYALSQISTISTLSDEGRTRAQFIYTVLHQALIQRHQQLLVDWIIDTLNQLHLNKVLTTTEQDDLEQYWLLLERFEQDGLITDFILFTQEFNRLYSQKVTPARLQIMTIHKSKGLEFDCVILPGLSSKSSNPDKPLMRWLKLPTQDQGELLLISPVKAAHHEQCLLYDYLGKLDQEKEHYEHQRLFYVAVTRAKKRLYLLDPNTLIRTGSFRDLLPNQDFIKIDEPASSSEQAKKYPDLFHLPMEFYQTLPHFTPPDSSAALLINNNNMPRLIGIVAHELLQWICHHHPSQLADVPWALADYSLKKVGFIEQSLIDAHALIKKQITQLFNDPIGQWIIKKHQDEKNEYELLTQEQDEVVTRIIDRTFTDQDICWIIDFKTGRDDTKTQTQHRLQLNEYADLLSHQTSYPIRCGLYYLTDGKWVHWESTKLITT